MGCATSKIDVDEKFAVEQNAKIERKIRQDKKLDARTVKILLLGAQLSSLLYGDCNLANRLFLQVPESRESQLSSNR